jgi:sporulation protein YlmC with PRC-barrel domain
LDVLPTGCQKGKIRTVGYAAGAGMKLFATELRGKTVMTEDGQVLGVLEDFLLEMKTGRIQSLLVTPAESVESRLFKTDPRGRLILSFRSMKAVRDVIVTQFAD